MPGGLLKALASYRHSLHNTNGISHTPDGPIMYGIRGKQADDAFALALPLARSAHSD